MMDLDTYAGRYTGQTRLRRLLLIAETTSDKALSGQAFRLVEQQMKREGNVMKYKEVFGGASTGQGGEATSSRRSRPPPAEFALDQGWVSQQQSKNEMQRQSLLGRVSSAQSSLNKEAIRGGYILLAEHDLRTGDLSQCLAGLIRAIDYCTSRTQTCQISISIIEVAFAMDQYATARDYTNKVEATVGPSSSSSSGNLTGGDEVENIRVKVDIARGIERMVAGDYKSAANILIPLVLKSGNTTGNITGDGEENGGNLLDWPGVASPEDLCIYASMLALATQDRTRILELAEHPEALASVPAMKELLLQCSRANYVQCLRAFSPSNKLSTVAAGAAVDAQPDQLMFSLSPVGIDVYINASRWNLISKKIREEMCIVQYLRPYQCVKLEKMFQLFYPAIATIEDLQDVLYDLMSRQLLPPNMRLDTRSNTLFQITPSSQLSTKDQLDVMEECVLDDTYAMLVRLACLESDLLIQGPKRGPESHRGRGGDSRGRNQGNGLMMFASGASPSEAADAYGDEDSHDDENLDGDFENATGDVLDVTMDGDTSMDVELTSAMNPEDQY